MKNSPDFLLLILIFIFGNQITVFAQQPNIEFQNYTDADGLSSNSINEMIEDSKGFIWIGTEDGLNKFDGYKFTSYRRNEKDSNSLYSNYIGLLYIDANDNLWIKSVDNVFSRLNIKTNKISRCPNLFLPIGISDKELTAFFIDSKNNYWIGTNKGAIYKVQLNENDISEQKIIGVNHCIDTSLINKINITRITEDFKGNIWVGANQCNLYKLKAETQSDLSALNFLRANSEFKDEKDSILRCIVNIKLDVDGRYWLISTNRIYLFNSEKHLIQNWKLDDWNPNMSNIFLSNNDFWMSDYLFIYRIDKVTLKLKKLKYNPKISYSPVFHHGRAIFVDRSGRLWTGSNSGLSCYVPNSLKFFRSRMWENLSNPIGQNRVRSFASNDSDLVWLGTDDCGVYRYNLLNNEYERVIQPDLNFGFRSYTYWALLYDDRKGLWMNLESNGLMYYNTDLGLNKYLLNTQNVINGFSGQYIKSIVRNSDDEIWIGSTKGLTKLNVHNGKSENYNFNKYDSEYKGNNRIIKCIAFGDSNVLWIGTEGAGFHRLQYNSKLKEPDIKHFDLADKSALGVGPNWVNTICKASTGLLWIGTYGGGLHCFDTKQLKVSATYTDKDGLPNNVVYGILEDNHANLWMSTNRGISKFNTIEKKFTNYTPDDGLQGYEYNSNAYYKNKKGEMFFGGTSGWNMFHPDSIKQNTSKPEIVFTDFQIFNKSISVNDSSILKKDVNYLDEISLNYVQSVFSLEFAALNFTNSVNNQYQYQLLGYDTSWQNIGTRRFITFTNLNPGRYVLKIKGSNNDGVWGNEKILRINILPEYYQTWWFRVLIIGAVLLIVSALYNYRRNYKREKKRIAQEGIKKEISLRREFAAYVHDDVKTGVAGIRMTTEIIEAAGEKFTRDDIMRRIKLVINSTKEIISSTEILINEAKPDADRIDKLFSEMNNHLAMSLSPEIMLIKEIPETENDLMIPFITRYNCYLIFKEAVRNLQRHSKCTRAHVTARLEQNRLLLSIKDNGKGFNADEIHNGNGVVHIKRRAEKINSDLKIISNENGTVITLEVILPDQVIKNEIVE